MATSRTLTDAHAHAHAPSGVVWVINLWNTLVRAAFFSFNVGRPLSEPSDSAMHTHPRREQEEEEEEEEARGVRGRGSERERETELHGNTQGHATETLEGIARHRTAPHPCPSPRKQRQQKQETFTGRTVPSSLSNSLSWPIVSVLLFSPTRPLSTVLTTRAKSPAHTPETMTTSI